MRLGEYRHEWWARALEAAAPTEVVDALGEVLAASLDCSDCLDEWAQYDLVRLEEIEEVLDLDSAYDAVEALRKIVRRFARR